MPEPGAGGGGQGGHCPPPQYLANKLTLFKPGEGRLSPPITTAPPNVFHLPASLSVYDEKQKVLTSNSFDSNFNRLPIIEHSRIK